MRMEIKSFIPYSYKNWCSFFLPMFALFLWREKDVYGYILKKNTNGIAKFVTFIFKNILVVLVAAGMR